MSKDEIGPYFKTGPVTRFQIILEEATRAKPDSLNARFVPPDADSFEKLMSKFHHVLYGRRGTGKSSLLRQIESMHKKNGKLVAWLDQEIVSELSYPDVLLVSLATVFSSFAGQIAALNPKPNLVKRLLGSNKLSKEIELVEDLRIAYSQLNLLRDGPDESNISWTSGHSVSASRSNEYGAGVEIPLAKSKSKLSYGKKNSKNYSQSMQVQRSYSASKREHLERSIVDYRGLMGRVSSKYPDSFVILDDFYRLSEQDQPNVAGYFHRIVKDNQIWLKFGSVSFWTRLYAGGSPSVGLQAPHDIKDISLDRGLLDFDNSKRFLEKVLSALANECDVDVHLLFNDGSLDRLVLAAGGVTRDYLSLVNDAISMAKNRGPSAKVGTNRVTVEDVNRSAGYTADRKYRDLEVDAGAQASNLRNLVIALTQHCRKTKSACFLVDVQNTDLNERLGRLQNMRFVHLISENETIPDAQSNRYKVYLLDVSQLTAQRAWRVDVMSWRNRSQRRARKLFFVESDSVEAIVEESNSLAAGSDFGEEPEESDEQAIMGVIELE